MYKATLAATTDEIIIYDTLGQEAARFPIGAGAVFYASYQLMIDRDPKRAGDYLAGVVAGAGAFLVGAQAAGLRPVISEAPELPSVNVNPEALREFKKHVDNYGGKVPEEQYRREYMSEPAPVELDDSIIILKETLKK